MLDKYKIPKQSFKHRGSKNTYMADVLCLCKVYGYKKSRNNKKRSYAFSVHSGQIKKAHVYKQEIIKNYGTKTTTPVLVKQTADGKYAYNGAEFSANNKDKVLTITNNRTQDQHEFMASALLPPDKKLFQKIFTEFVESFVNNQNKTSMGSHAYVWHDEYINDIDDAFANRMIKKMYRTVTFVRNYNLNNNVPRTR